MNVCPNLGYFSSVDAEVLVPSLVRPELCRPRFRARNPCHLRSGYRPSVGGCRPFTASRLPYWTITPCPSPLHRPEIGGAKLGELPVEELPKLLGNFTLMHTPQSGQGLVWITCERRILLQPGPRPVRSKIERGGKGKRRSVLRPPSCTFHECFQATPPQRVAEFLQRLAFDLTDALPRHPELCADHFERVFVSGEIRALADPKTEP